MYAMSSGPHAWRQSGEEHAATHARRPSTIASEPVGERVDEAFVGLRVRRLCDDQQGAPAAHPPQLMLESHEAGAVARQELEKVGPEIEARGVAPRRPETKERKEEHPNRARAPAKSTIAWTSFFMDVGKETGYRMTTDGEVASRSQRPTAFAPRSGVMRKAAMPSVARRRIRALRARRLSVRPTPLGPQSSPARSRPTPERNVARLSAAVGSPLHLVGPLGFRIDAHSVRRGRRRLLAPGRRARQHIDFEQFFGAWAWKGITCLPPASLQRHSATHEPPGRELRPPETRWSSAKRDASACPKSSSLKLSLIASSRFRRWARSGRAIWRTPGGLLSTRRCESWGRFRGHVLRLRRAVPLRLRGGNTAIQLPRVYRGRWPSMGSPSSPSRPSVRIRDERSRSPTRSKEQDLSS